MCVSAKCKTARQPTSKKNEEEKYRDLCVTYVFVYLNIGRRASSMRPISQAKNPSTRRILDVYLAICRHKLIQSRHRRRQVCVLELAHIAPSECRVSHVYLLIVFSNAVCFFRSK